MQPLLETFRAELSRRHIPWQYVERATAELADHERDLAEELGDSDEALAAAAQRLGDPVRLAASTAAAYRARSFAGRHPVLVFLAAPLPLAAALWAVCVVCCVAIGFVLVDKAVGIEGKTVSEMQPLAIWSLLSLHYTCALAPWAATAVLLVRWAYWSGRGWRWALASTAIVAIAAASYQDTLILPQEPGGGRWMMTFGLGAQLAVYQWFQFVVTLLAGGYCLWRLRRKPVSMLQTA